LRCVLAGALAFLLLPTSLFPTSAWAQADDTAYCVELGELAVRYTGSPGADGGIRPNFAVLEAIDNCSKGNTAAGIQVLEKILRSNGLTLPKRVAPA
jgi:hypothetical protein